MLKNFIVRNGRKVYLFCVFAQLCVFICYIYSMILRIDIENNDS